MPYGMPWRSGGHGMNGPMLKQTEGGGGSPCGSEDGGFNGCGYCANLEFGPIPVAGPGETGFPTCLRPGDLVGPIVYCAIA